MPIVSGIKPDYLNNDSIKGYYTNSDHVRIDTSISRPVDTVYYSENFLQKRNRLEFGVEFLWGKVYEMSQTFAFEFYFGAGVNFTIATRTDHARYATYHSKVYNNIVPNTDTPDPKDYYPVTDDNQRRNQSVPDFIDKSLYARPAVVAGIKLRIRM
jgi:hypothetical protein